MSNDATRHIPVRVPQDVRDALEEIAHRNERTMTGEIKWALRQYVAEQTAGRTPAS